uniref:Uncharacterized protein n=1 Tax=Arundo donax TaxID=35708 RepID=A0A0A9AZC0_ARUDO
MCHRAFAATKQCRCSSRGNWKNILPIYSITGSL